MIFLSFFNSLLLSTANFAAHLKNILPQAGMGVFMKLMKFGGTSVGLPQRMHEVAKLITNDTAP